MTYSMTAFAKIRNIKGNNEYLWEIRSVNNRFLDVSLRLPEQFKEMEPKWRALIAARINRGKIDCTLSCKIDQEQSDISFKLNLDIVRKLLKTSNHIHTIFGNAATPLSTIDILRWPGVTQETILNLNTKSIISIEKALQKALLEFNLTRLREGKKLQYFLLKRLNTIERLILAIQKKMPETIKKQKKRLINKLSELKAKFDHSRLEQEILYFAERIDISEELDRLKAHSTEVRRVLQNESSCGRRLDFLMQEFNREVNTIASKSASKEITSLAVELKVLIEQMREQIQNIE